MRKLALAAVLVLMASGAQAAPITGLIAHYEFEDNLIDSVSGASGTGFGAISYETGVSGQAINLDNGPTSDVFYLNEYAQLRTLTLGSEFTVSHWVRLDGVVYPHGGASFFAGRGSAPSGSLNFAVDTNRSIGVGVSQGASASEGLPWVGIGDGEFHHAASTVQGGQIKFFIDGSLLATGTINGPISLENVETFIGFHQWENVHGQFGSSRFDGAIDDLRIYDRALSASEIAAIPEPSTALLLGLGPVGLAARRRG